MSQNIKIKIYFAILYLFDQDYYAENVLKFSANFVDYVNMVTLLFMPVMIFRMIKHIFLHVSWRFTSFSFYFQICISAHNGLNYC